MTCFIDSTAWIAIVHKQNPNHTTASEYFQQLLEEDAKLVTNNVAIDQTLSHLKSENNSELARKFLTIIDESVLTINLRMDWISRRVRRNALNQFLKSSDTHLTLSHFYINETLKRKRVDIIFSFDQALRKFGLPLMPQTSVAA
jgi:predicted nucleic acid-binding protein